MLTGVELGAAIESARKLKGVTKVAMASHFGVKPPSIQDWVKRGTVDKAKLPALWTYFADVAGPEHWGLPTPVSAAALDAKSPPAAAMALLQDWRLQASHRSAQTIDHLIRLAQKDSLKDRDWQLIDELAARLGKR